MAPRKKEIPLIRIYQALMAAEGNIGRAAQLLGVSRALLVRRMKENEKLEEARADKEMVAFDKAWLGIYRAIEDQHFPTIKWFLTRYGGERGYGLKKPPRVIPLQPHDADMVLLNFREEAKMATIKRERAKLRRSSGRAETCAPSAGPKPKQTGRP